MEVAKINRRAVARRVQRALPNLAACLFVRSLHAWCSVNNPREAAKWTERFPGRPARFAEEIVLWWCKQSCMARGQPIEWNAYRATTRTSISRMASAWARMRPILVRVAEITVHSTGRHAVVHACTHPSSEIGDRRSTCPRTYYSVFYARTSSTN